MAADFGFGKGLIRRPERGLGGNFKIHQSKNFKIQHSKFREDSKSKLQPEAQERSLLKFEI
jgi:hypothetical protein